MSRAWCDRWVDVASTVVFSLGLCMLSGSLPPRRVVCTYVLVRLPCFT